MLGEEKFLVTGAMGCLGAWTIRALLDEGTPAVAFDLSTDRRRLSLLATDGELEAVHFAQGDITDLAALMALVREQQITHIVHLAALQVPFCKADPVRGAQVNVVGTVKCSSRLLPATIRCKGSSMRVRSPCSAPHLCTRKGAPTTNRRHRPGRCTACTSRRTKAPPASTPRITGSAPSDSGPGRCSAWAETRGLTSAPTTAMLAAAAGHGYHVPYGGASVYQFAPDVARLALSAARAAPDGAVVSNLGGASVAMEQIVTAIREVVPDVSSPITFDDVALPFPSAVDASGLDRLVGGARYTPFEEGVRLTVEAFSDLLARGLLRPPDEDGPGPVEPGGNVSAAREGHR